MENSAAMSASQFQQVSEAMRGSLEPGTPVIKKAKVVPPCPQLHVPSFQRRSFGGSRAGKDVGAGGWRGGDGSAVRAAGGLGLAGREGWRCRRLAKRRRVGR